MRARLGAGRPKSLLQGIINSGVSQGRLVFIKLRQLNTVAALKCYNWKADCDDVHRQGPAPRHRGGMGGKAGQAGLCCPASLAGPGRGHTANAQPGGSLPCRAYTLWTCKTKAGEGNKGEKGLARGHLTARSWLRRVGWVPWAQATLCPMAPWQAPVPA